MRNFSTDRVIWGVFAALLFGLGIHFFNTQYLNWNLYEVTDVLKQREQVLVKLMDDLSRYQEKTLFIGTGKDALIGEKVYIRADNLFFEKQFTPGTTEYRIQDQIGKISQSGLESVRHRSKSGFSFESAYFGERISALLFCDRPERKVCLDAYYAEVIAIKPLKQHWWYVNGMFKDNWEK
jgi:hypothetical protein